MTLYERYLNGQTKQVYEEINALGQDAFSPAYLPDIEKVLTETFQRVAYNLDTIYKALKEAGYLFNINPQTNSEKPLHQPLPNTATLIRQLERVIQPFGYLPLSIKYFYQIVGGVNFVWDYETSDDLMWPMADPIQIESLDSVAEAVTDPYWKEDIQEYVNDEDFGCAFIELAADDYHKDNVSGGQPYAIQITEHPSIDGDFMNERNGTTFINYLRICFGYCGFPGMATQNTNTSYLAFYYKVKPLLKPI